MFVDYICYKARIAAAAQIVILFCTCTRNTRDISEFFAGGNSGKKLRVFDESS